MAKPLVDRLILENSAAVTDLDSLAKGYILSCRCEGKSPKTIAIYETVLRNLLWLCREKDFPQQPQRITAAHVREFLWYLSSENRWGGRSTSARKPASKTTVRDYYGVLRIFFSWLEREGLIAESPFKNLKNPKVDKKVIKALNPDEVKRLLKACAGKTTLDIRNKAIVCILLDCGMRVSELASLILEDVSPDTGVITVRCGKGGKQRLVHMGEQTQKALWRYVSIYRRGRSDRLFLNRSGEPLDVDGVKILIRRLGDSAGTKVHPHKLRHTFAITFLRAGGDVFSLQYLLGHSTLTMTQRYLQSLNADDAIKSHRKFSPLDNLSAKG